jgi:hypothetical protein
MKEQKPTKYYVRFLAIARRHWSMNSPAKRACLKRASVKTPQGMRWRCAICNGLFDLKKKEIQCDHIIPLGSNVPPGKPELFEVLDRMECETELLQILCKPCHKVKTNHEKYHKSRLTMINTVAYYMGVQHGFLANLGQSELKTMADLVKKIGNSVEKQKEKLEAKFNKLTERYL